MLIRVRELLFLGILGWALSANTATHNEATLESLPLAAFGQLSGKFKQVKVLKELDVQLNTQGNFQVQKAKDGRSVFHWNVEKPKVSQICIDSVGMKINNKNLKFSEVGKETGEQIAGFLKLITMDQSKILSEFNAQKKGKLVVLSPKSADKAFFETAEIEINKAGLVENLVIKEKTQDEIQIRFSDLKTKSLSEGALSDSATCSR